MQTTIKRACGHSETIQVYGSSSERERKEAYEATKQCAACRQAAAGATGLTGTPKQVAWASDIKAKVVGQWREIAARESGPGLTLANLVVERAEAQMDARWWIEHQDRAAAAKALVSKDEIAALQQS